MRLIHLQISFHIVVFFLTTISYAQYRIIQITAQVDKLPDESIVHIAGNTNDMGNWNEMLPMRKVSEKRWSFEIMAEIGDTLEFKFTRGNWSLEAVDSNNIEYPNFFHLVTVDTHLVYIIPSWRDLAQQKIILSADRLKNKAGIIELLEGWTYKIGDDSMWASPSFDDSSWEMISPFLSTEDFDKLEWTGNIWFRNHIVVDSSLWNRPLGLVFSTTGAADIFLDGNLIYEYGVVGDSEETEVTHFDRTPRYIIFDEKENHVLAVRYSNFKAEEITNYEIQAGFNAIIGDLNMFITSRIEIVRERSIIQMAFSSFILAFAIMHLLLYLFYPKARENFYYAISMFSFAVTIFVSVQGDFINSIMTAIDLSILNSVAVQTAIFFGLLTVYASTYGKMPKQYIFFAVFWALFVIHSIYFPLYSTEYTNYAYYIYALLLSLEILRVLIRSLIRKESWGWGWMIGVGFLVAFIFIVYQLLIMVGFVRPLFGIYLVYVYGIVFLAITVSINLSKKVADTNKDLEEQLVQVKELSQKTILQERKVKDEELARKILEADNERKTKELEEAQKLQLSMLPRDVPKLQNIEIAAYMKPASEVGGDYYDFKYDDSGILTVAVGDATGHGMIAGTMVATFKGLFSAEPKDTELVPFFNKCNSIIRNMKLGNLYMAMVVAKIEDYNLKFSSAGMPPILIYRSQNHQVEELILKAMPLGGAKDFKYEQKNTPLNTGDTLLFMSDGFPELFNKQKKMLSFNKAKEVFGKYAELSPSKIIEELCNTADEWKEGIDQHDDITFVVLKVR